MFSKILVANRGEIALRVMRACREMSIAVVAVYSEADAESLHLSQADEAVRIGPGPSAQSYLNAERIVAAAVDCGAEAVHPGYGYLAENAAFAEACTAAGLTFIGPTPENLRLAGDKIAAKQAMEAAGIPVVPSSPGALADVETAAALCGQIGYPVMIKSAGGGGGRGIRICRDEDALREEFPVARMEARAAFGDDQVYLEKFIVSPRHIEFQVLADADGRVVDLGERECTIQRRYQKLIEEAPSPRLSEAMRREMGRAAVAAAQAIDYRNAGTVEFLVDAEDRFYFMELNARIQVEHPVTELVTGVDLVQAQIRIAAGERLDGDWCRPQPRGWALECRINAEDPERMFLPCPGVVETYRPPGGPGVRIDTHLYQGYELPVYYDSLIAKLIAYGRTRDDAIAVMKRALAEFRIDPLKTPIPLYATIMDDPRFRAGDFDTGFITRFVPEEEDDDDDDDDEE